MTEEAADGKYLKRSGENNIPKDTYLEIAVDNRDEGGNGGKAFFSNDTATFGTINGASIAAYGENLVLQAYGIITFDTVNKVKGLKVETPTADDMPANKAYVDSHVPSAMKYEVELPEKPSTPVADGEEIPYTWEQINAITLAGKAQEYFSLGSTKLVNLSTPVLGANAATMMVIGFDQDGENTTTFQTKGVLPNDTVLGSPEWIESTARSLCRDFYSYCEAKNFIKAVSKGTCPSIDSSRNGSVTYNNETVWLPSEREMGSDFGSSISVANSTTSKAECTQGYNAAYSYYTGNTRRIKYVMNANGTLTTTVNQYWMRSIFYNASNYVCRINNDGSVGFNTFRSSHYLAPAFVIGIGKAPASKITQDSKDITDKVKRTLSPSYTATISTTWVENSDTGVQSQSVAIDGIKASDVVIVDHVYNGDSYDTFVEAQNQYLNYITNGYAETYDGGITFYIFADANTVNIPIIVEVA